VQVAETGKVNLPLVGAIPAAGKTAQEFERELEAKLGAKYLQSPQVTVYVKENNSQRATVEGAVKKPGVYQIKGKTSLLQFVAMAEGLDASSDSTAVVFRQVNGQRSAAKFDIDAIRAGRANDPAIHQGDVIVVGTSAIKAAFNNVLRVLPAAGAFVPLL
jgi:polysaccharide export outer membrane protein